MQLRPCFQLTCIVSRKCSKWVIGKKTAIGDKAAIRRSEQGISWERLPFATRPIVTSQDMTEQREVVSALRGDLVGYIYK